jgi:hypothetical protein
VVAEPHAEIAVADRCAGAAAGKENGPMRGHFQIEASTSMFVVVMVVPDEHNPVVVMPAVFAMLTILGARAAVMLAIAVPDDDGFSTGDRRRRNANGNDGNNDI